MKEPKVKKKAKAKKATPKKKTPIRINVRKVFRPS